MTRRKWQGRAFHALCFLAVLVALGMLAVLLIYICVQGWSRVDWASLPAFLPATLIEREYRPRCWVLST